MRKKREVTTNKDIKQVITGETSVSGKKKQRFVRLDNVKNMESNGWTEVKGAPKGDLVLMEK